MTGVVERYISTKGFGYIKSDKGERYFFYWNDVSNFENGISIKDGDFVEFDVYHNIRNGMCATNISKRDDNYKKI